MGAERIKTVSIIEILNSDMPFLLDSVLGELTEQGFGCRLVLHPILTVERDHNGALIGFRGEGPASAPRSARASSISTSSASKTRRGGPRSSAR
jgi:glutamate dehydrogenase